MFKNRKFLLLFFVLILFAPALLAKASTFNPNYIISDSEVLNYISMDLNYIQQFLRSKNSYLATYSTTDPDGKSMTAAEIIYDRATANKVNPKFLIVLLQKEQSLIEDTSPKQSQLDWATGYGCPDNSPCNVRWKGFWKQVNSASLQFRDYMDNPHLYNYKKGNSYTLSNTNREDIQVTIVNNATAALYNYTPHVYNGNYNFHKIWQRYFTRNYPNGALLQAEGETGVWLIQDGKKRPFLTRTALHSRFDPNKVVVVNKIDLDKYEKGAPIKFPQYSLVRSPRGTIFLLVDSYRRGFSSSGAFKKIGFNPEEVLDASWEDINSYLEGPPITATSTYPTGALLQNNKTGGVYWIFGGDKSPLWDPVLLKTKFKNKNLIPVSPEELDNYKTIAPIAFEDGELVKSPTSPAVFLLADGKKRAFISSDIFEGLGYKWKNIISVHNKILNLYPTGEVLTEIIESNSEETKKNNL